MSITRPVTTSDRETIDRLRLQCWGDFGLVDPASGADVKPRGRKARALLAYLAFHPGKVVSRERLTGLLWGDRAEEQARASLRQAILELKSLAGGRGLLTIERNELTLNRSALVTDIDEMRAAVEGGNYADFLAMLPDRDESLFGNLDGVDETFDDWLAIERTRQRDALVTLIADASAGAVAHGQTRHARALHERRLEFDPDAETLPDVAAAAPRKHIDHAAPAQPVTGSWPVRRRAAIWAAVLGVFAAVFAGGWYFARSSEASAATVAVLPFRTLADDDASFADGLSDEITTQLARQPGLRVAGRTSAAQFRDANGDLAAIGRKLRVDYVLEGSVRSSGDRVRVNVALAKSSDGMQLWAETFDGTLDDVLSIQYRIGASVARALNLKLAGAGPPTGSLATSGQVYSLYLSARGLIRERNPNAFRAAREKLQRALQLDPNFAPAWSSLAQIENPGGVGPDLEVRRNKAIAEAQQALALSPDLAEAHGVLGMLYGFDTALGGQHIERAAALDPNNAEFQYWLGNVYGAAFDFGRMMDAYRRAYALDPLWNYAQEALVKGAWEMGYRGEALSVARRIEADGSTQQAHLIRARLASLQGDISEQLRESTEASAAASDPGRKAYAEMSRATAFDKLNLTSEAADSWRRSGVILAPEFSQRGPQRLPTIAELRRLNATTPYSWKEIGYVGRSAKQLINAGRAGDVVQLYDGDGLLQISRRELPQMHGRVLEDGPTIAAALRAVGRGGEANRILAHLDRQIDAALRRNGGRAPGPFLAVAARTWAMIGKRDAALSALERALANGWLYVNDDDDSSMADFGDEPAFRQLRGDPRFEAIRSRINGQLAKERREALAQVRA